MKILVEKIIFVDSSIHVDFSTDYGKATALWEGEKPTINFEYHVEIDIDDSLTWEKDIIKNETGEYSIQMHDNRIFLAGMLDSVDDDGYAVLRIGESIITFVTNGIPFVNGSFIKLISKTVTLSQIDYF